MAFRRTVRVPENDDSPLIPGFIPYGPGNETEIPAYVETDDGGSLERATSVTTPMYPGEAFYARFFQTDGVFAVIPIVNGINAITGEPETAESVRMKAFSGGQKQNYVVIEGAKGYHDTAEGVERDAYGLPWMDNIRTAIGGDLGQMVTANQPTHAGMSSLSASDNPAMEMVVIPMKRSVYDRLFGRGQNTRTSGTKAVFGGGRDLTPSLEIEASSQPVGYGFPEDRYVKTFSPGNPNGVWEESQAKRLTFSIPDARIFYALSREPKPEGYEPLTRADYAAAKWLPGDVRRHDNTWTRWLDRLFPDGRNLDLSR